MIRTLQHVSNSIINFAKSYKDHVFDVLEITKESNESLRYWRNSTFGYAVIFGAPLSIIALVPGVYYSLLTGVYVLAVYDVLAFVLMCFIAFSRSASIVFKKYLLIGSVFILSSILIISIGVSGPGLIYLYACVLAAIIFFPSSTKWIWSCIGTAICLIAGLLFHFDLAPHSSVPSVDVLQWVAVASNFVFLSFFTSAMIPQLFVGLEKSLLKNQELLAQSQIDQESLELANIKLYKRNEELEAFAHAASHDLKEPVRIIHSFMSRLKMNYANDMDEKANSYVNYSIDASKRMMRLVDDLLVYAKLEEKSIFKEMEEVDVEELITEIIFLHVNDNDSKSVEFTYESLPVIKAAKIPLKIVFTNLISNALKYSSPLKTLKVKILFEETDDYWRFTVKDNGIRIDKQYFRSIFDMFSRLHAQNEIDGSGIGLAVCKRIIENHSGTIGVISEVNEGSEFLFTIRKY